MVVARRLYLARHLFTSFILIVEQVTDRRVNLNIHIMTDKSKLSFGFLSFLHCGVLQIDGLVIYGGLKRRTQRESEELREKAKAEIKC